MSIANMYLSYRYNKEIDRTSMIIERKFRDEL